MKQTTYDIFDLWKRYKVVGPSYVSGIRDSEWELQDVIDNHGYSKEWSGTYIDENEYQLYIDSYINKQKKPIIFGFF